MTDDAKNALEYVQQAEKFRQIAEGTPLQERREVLLILANEYARMAGCYFSPDSVIQFAK